MPNIVLLEQDNNPRDINELDQSVAIEIGSKFGKIIDVRFPTPISQKYLLKTNSLIGYITLSDDTIIHIKPKVNISNIFLMLEYAYDLHSFQFLDGKIELEEIDQLYEKLSLYLAQLVLERYRKGLYRDYIKKEESLPYLTGRLLIDRTIKSANYGSTLLECEYCDNTADIIDNKILAWTLYMIPRLNIQREDVRNEVRQAFMAISSSVEVTSIEPKECINRLYNRLNQDYQPMHALCRFFLEQSGPLADNGEHEFIPFILNMDNLFEAFVASWLEKHIPDNISVERQCWDYLDDKKIFRIRIDLVLRDSKSGKVLAVLDTKYKKSKTPSTDDISQIILYAIHMNTNKAFLIFPTSDNYHDTLPIKSIEVTCLSFNIGKNLEESGQEFLNNLLNRI